MSDTSHTSWSHRPLFKNGIGGILKEWYDIEVKKVVHLTLKFLRKFIGLAALTCVLQFPSIVFAQIASTKITKSTGTLHTIQRMLNDLGYEAGEADGSDNSATQTAIRSFQMDNGLTVTGSFTKAGSDLLREFHEVSFGKGSIASPIDGTNSTEVSSKDNLVPHDTTQNFLKKMKSLDDRADNIRSTLINQPEYFLASIGEGIHPHLLKNLIDKSSISRFLEPSIVIPACWEDEVKIAGFYNVVQDIWLIVWLDSDNNILRGRLTTGFSPKDFSPGTSWDDLIDKNTTYLGAMNEAFYTQLASFFTIFSAENCNRNIGEMDTIFTKNRAAEEIEANEKIFSAVKPDIVEKMNLDTEWRHKIRHSQKLISFGALPLEDNDLDYISFHTMKNDRYMMLIQTWKLDNSVLVVVDQEFGFLNGDEIQ